MAQEGLWAGLSRRCGLWACGPGEEKEAGEETALGLVWGGENGAF